MTEQSKKQLQIREELRQLKGYAPFITYTDIIRGYLEHVEKEMKTQDPTIEDSKLANNYRRNLTLYKAYTDMLNLVDLLADSKVEETSSILDEYDPYPTKK